MRRLLLAVVVSAIVSAPAAGSSQTWWFKTPGSAAYCGFDDKGWICFRPTDGFWVRFVFGRRETDVDVRKGTSERYVGFAGAAERTLRFGETQYTSDAAVITCWSRRTAVTCKHFMGLSFSLGRQRGHRIFWDAPGAPPKVRPLFRTHHGIYCGIDLDNLEQANPILGCWRPADGLLLGLAHDNARRRGSHRHWEKAIDFRPPGFRTLSFGSTFQWRCRSVTLTLAESCSTVAGVIVFTCTSTQPRLTCRNRSGNGFWASARSFYTF